MNLHYKIELNGELNKREIDVDSQGRVLYRILVHRIQGGAEPEGWSQRGPLVDLGEERS